MTQHPIPVDTSRDNGASPGWYNPITGEWDLEEPTLPASVQTAISSHHTRACKYAGLKVEGRANLDDPECCCDPDGSRIQRHLDFMRRYRRTHVLWQEETWFNKDGDAIRVTDMSLTYKRNVLAFLERRAPRLKMAYEVELAFAPVQGEMASDAIDDLLTETMDTLATTWLYRTPLVLRLEQLVREGHDGPIR